MAIGSGVTRVTGAPVATPRASPAVGRTGKPRTTRFIEVLREGVQARPPPPARGSPLATAVRPPTKTASASASPSPVKRLLQNTLDSEKKLDAVLQAAAHGKTFSPQELLAMQAEVFRYSQTVELVSRSADRVVGAVKQTLGTQV